MPDRHSQDSISSSIEVGIVISFLSCPNNVCPSTVGSLGTILYNGPFKPSRPNPNPYHLQPNRNFRVHIPKGATKGKAQLIVTHFNLVGVRAAISTALNYRANIDTLYRRGHLRQLMRSVSLSMSHRGCSFLEVNGTYGHILTTPMAHLSSHYLFIPHNGSVHSFSIHIIDCTWL